jgi:hypothetical protein
MECETVQMIKYIILFTSKFVRSISPNWVLCPCLATNRSNRSDYKRSKTNSNQKLKLKPTMLSPNSKRYFLENVSVADVIAFKKSSIGVRQLVSVKDDTPLIEVLQILQEEQITTVPVYKTLLETDAMHYFDMVSVTDILRWSRLTELFDGDLSEETLLQEIKDALAMPVSCICEPSTKKGYPLVPSSQKLSSLTRLFSYGFHHCLGTLKLTKWLKTKRQSVITLSLPITNSGSSTAT